MYRDIPDDLRALIEPVVEDHGFELVDVVVTRGAGSAAIRVTIDRVEGDGLVPVGVCADVSREIESQFDAGEAVTENYRLEVSSPGLDRTLAREKDFAAACKQAENGTLLRPNPVLSNNSSQSQHLNRQRLSSSPRPWKTSYSPGNSP